METANEWRVGTEVIVLLMQIEGDKIFKSKEYIYNYVDRVRFAEGAFPDYKCPSRGSGWRHNKSISHLDLATSCHSAASGLNHWSSSHPTSRHQLRHSRSLDYNHIDRCKDALDIAEYYWRLDHDPEVYDEEEEEVITEPEHTGSQLKYVSEHHLTQHYRDFKCADDNYHHSANSVYQTSPPQQNNNRPANTATLPTAASQQQQQQQAFDFGSDSCSLRRSRSLAVIREETFSDLQISSSNGSRRSQLIPRARLVNRGYFRERDRLICNNNKHHHHHHTSREKLINCSGSGSSAVGCAGPGSIAPSVDGDEHSNESIAETCESHQQQSNLQHYKQQQQKSHNQQQQQQQQHLHYHPLYCDSQSSVLTPTAAANDYYDHLKRLDKLALGLVAEQLHPWHNDKSDLESLNSDYFKNSLHQSHELKQQLEIEALEQAVNLLTHDKPRIYQSRRQKRNSVDKSLKLSPSTGASGGESCPENSQSSVFPETTTSNSDDQSDSGSLSEQEYDITKIEEIYQKTHIEGDEESYEIISLTTTTRTRFETTEDEEDEEAYNNNRHLDECDYTIDHDEEDTEGSNQHTTTDTEIEGTLKRSRTICDNLQKIIAYDSVYLSSEESSDTTLVDIDPCDTSLEVASLRTCIDEVETLLHISIEDSIYEPKAKQHRVEIQSGEWHTNEPIGFVETVNTKIEILEEDSCDEVEAENTAPIYTQILKVEHTPSNATQHSVIVTAAPIGVTSSVASKPKILSVVEKRKLKRYSDSAYSSNVSDSSEKAYGGNYSTNESYAFASHLKRQVAEPLYIPLKSNLSDNQYHSLPDVYIGQSLKVSESIDAQLRSSYNSDKYRSLDDTSVDCQLHDNAEAAVGSVSQAPETHYVENNNSSGNKSSRKKREEIVTSEQIYDSIKRFGRAHQRYRQKEIKECQQQHQCDAANENTSKVLQQVVEDLKDSPIETPGHNTSKNIAENSNNETVIQIHVETTLKNPIENKISHESSNDKTVVEIPPTPSEQYDSFEKSKEAPAVTVENFSQQIERRAKEIQRSGRRNKFEQIEFANRSKFRLENTLKNVDETNETKAYAPQRRAPSSTFRIVVTDAQNNIIEEDSIERQEQQRQHQLSEEAEAEKENQNIINLQEGKVAHDSYFDDLFMIKNNRDRFKEKSTTLNVTNKQGTLKRAPSKPKRQQYPVNNTSHQHLSSAETQKLLLSPKSKERRVLSNQIYRARPVKVITATDSFRRNKVKQANTKMSRPQILQVIDNKRKSQVCGHTNTIATKATNSSNIDDSQVENEYLKKVDAVRCYWSKLVNDENVDESQKQSPQDYAHVVTVTQVENLPTTETHESPPQTVEKEQMPKQLNDKVDTNLKHPQQLQQHHHHPEKRQFILGAQSDKVTNAITTNTTNQATVDHKSSNMTQHSMDEYYSFMPSIEIVELDGDKKATIVSAMPSNATADETLDANEPQFDHIRYKVLKSQQLLRSNVLARNKKEAQFDGLIQYLQDYSFQELLSNNNVVIVEPVRTKIERPTSASCYGPTNHFAAKDKTLSVQNKKSHANTDDDASVVVENVRRKQRIMGSTISGCGGSGIKRHFFYQPVRVNRELYEEELPNPDTVRNVRKFFEEHILPTPGQGLLTTAVTTTAATTTTTEGTSTTTTTTTTTATLAKTMNKNNGNMLAKQTSPKSRRTRKYRYLTIDTSYGHATTTEANRLQKTQSKSTSSQQSRKWDTASLSSGVSSGDLSSPCDYNETETANEREVNQSNTPNCVVVNNTSRPTVQQRDDEHAVLQGVHVLDIVKKHNNSSVKKSRTSGAGIPVRSSSVRPRNGICGYATLHKPAKSNIYRNMYEHHAIQGHHHMDNDSDDRAVTVADEDDNDDDDEDLFGDDANELCDTYYVSNDVLRKIRECGSSVTYYGGRVVQTSTPGPVPTTFESHYNDSGNKGSNASFNVNNSNNKTMTLQNPTMLSQTQTRARVREIETCSNAACYPANECLLHNSSSNKQPLLEQKRIHLIASDSKQQNKAFTAATTRPHQQEQQQQPQYNIGNTIPQGHRSNTNNSSMEGGITFKLVKSNSCSSRLELAGTGADILVCESEPEETEVVRKMVHHFETSKNNRLHNDTDDPPPPLTINNQMPICRDEQQHEVAGHQQARVDKVTVNNHINVAEGVSRHDNLDEQSRQEEPKTYQTEAKDILLDQSRGALAGSGTEAAVTAKVSRNKNVDLAFSLVKQQQPQQSKSPGIKEQEIGENHKLKNFGKQKNASNNPEHFIDLLEMKCVTTYENTVNDSHKMSTGNFKVVNDESAYKTDSPAKLTIPAQIIVPVEIHRAALDNQEANKQQTSPSSSKAAEERSFLPLSTTSSVTSVIDKSVVKHYVANDKSIYEKRKYDDIEFEEFEIYDPTKEFEKIIEDEEAQQYASTNHQQHQQQPTTNEASRQQDGQQSATSTTSSMRTTKRQQTMAASTETETDCYDSLDDKL